MCLDLDAAFGLFPAHKYVAGTLNQPCSQPILFQPPALLSLWCVSHTHNMYFCKDDSSYCSSDGDGDVSIYEPFLTQRCIVWSAGTTTIVYNTISHVS